MKNVTGLVCVSGRANEASCLLPARLLTACSALEVCLQLRVSHEHCCVTLCTIVAEAKPSFVEICSSLT